MRTHIALIALTAVLSTSAFAQKSMSTTNPNAVQIQGNTNIQAEQKGVAAKAEGKDNTAKNTAGAIKGGTQIQGNTNIKAKQTNATAVAKGQGNTAVNEAGVIGGK